MVIKKSFITVSLGLLLFISCQTAESSSSVEIKTEQQLISVIKEYINSEMHKHNIPGLSIVLINNNRVSWAEGFGKSNIESGTEASEKTVYNVGSITKLFTATAIMQLNEQGLLNLDSPIKEFIPELDIKSIYNKDLPITVRMLMTHQSGLPNNKLSNWWGDSDETFNDLVYYLNNNLKNYPSGFKFNYSNIGVSLLGVIIERVTGETFIDYTKENILIPLEMSTASFISLADRDDIDSRLISKAHPSQIKNTIDDYSVRDTPAGSLNGSVLDMSNFIIMINGNGTFKDKEVLSSESINEMIRVQHNNNPIKDNTTIGLNFFIPQDRDLNYMGKVVGHKGATMFHYSFMMMVPEHNIGVMISTNSNSGVYAFSEIGTKLLQYSYKLKTGIDPPRVVKNSIKEKVKLTESVVERVVGRYVFPEGEIVIYSKGDRLKAKNNGQVFDLYANSDGTFSICKKRFGLIPMNNDLFNNITIEFHQSEILSALIYKEKGITKLIAERVELENIPDIWEGRTGIYKVINPPYIDFLEPKADSEIPLFIKDGELYFGTVLIKPIDNNNAYTLGERDHIRIYSDKKNEIVELSGYRYQKID